MTTRRRLLLGTAAGLLAPARTTADDGPKPTAPGGPPVDIGRRFREFGLTGTFLLQSVHDDTLLIHDPARADREFLPASTFKIPNALIALETGVVRDENEVFKWDGRKREFDSWNRDHDLRSAMAASAVWFYQEIARRIGEARMKEWIDRLGYGNRDISGGIDRFWLDGALRITPRQQLDFMRRVQADDLPFSERSRRIVKDILVLEKTDTYVLRGKTGWAAPIGWLAGWIERGPQAWLFVLNVDMPKGAEQAAQRRPLTAAILTDLGLMEVKP